MAEYQPRARDHIIELDIKDVRRRHGRPTKRRRQISAVGAIEVCQKLSSRLARKRVEADNNLKKLKARFEADCASLNSVACAQRALQYKAARKKAVKTYRTDVDSEMLEKRQDGLFTMIREALDEPDLEPGLEEELEEHGWCEEDFRPV